jgi:hypothetical protein
MSPRNPRRQVLMLWIGEPDVHLLATAFHTVVLPLTNVDDLSQKAALCTVSKKG